MKEHKDRISSLLLILTMTITVLWILKVSEYLAIAGSVLALVSIVIYSKRVLALSPEVRDPFAETLFAMAGINLALFMIAPTVNISVLKQFIPVYSLLFLITGALSKLFLFNRFFVDLLHRIKYAFFYIIDWSRNSIINVVRALLSIISLIMYGSAIENSNAYAILIMSVVVVLSSMNSWNGRYVTTRLQIFILMLYPILPYILNTMTGFAKIASLIFMISVFVWLLSIPSIVNKSKSVYHVLADLISTYPLRSLQFVSFISAFIALFSVASDEVLGIPLNIALFLILIAFSIHHIIINIIKFFYPVIKSILMGLYSMVNSIEKILPVFATILIFIPFNFTFNQYVDIGIIVFASILYAFSWNQLIMKFVDSLVFGVGSFVYSFLKLLKMILQFFGLRNIIRNMFNFVKNLLLWIYNLTVSILKTIWENIVLLLLWLLALFFVLLGLGLIIPIFPLATIIFANIMGNFTIQLIVGGFLIIIGVLSFKEVTSRRNQFRLEGSI